MSPRKVVSQGYALLDVDSIVPFLINAGLLRGSTVARGGLRAQEVPRRNRNLSVTTHHGSGFFIKQSDGIGSGSWHTLRREGEFYLQHGTDPGSLAEILPRLLIFEPEAPLIVLEFLPNHITLADRAARPGPASHLMSLWRQVAATLARTHDTLTRAAPCERHETFDPLSVPMGFIRPPIDLLSIASPALLTVLRILRESPVLASGLERLPEIWHRNTMIHGDLRVDNLLVPDIAEPATPGVRIIDWELFGLGDAMWDLAGLLEFGVRSLVLDGEQGGAHPLSGAAALMQSAHRTLVREYHETRGWSVIDSSKLAILTAARLVHSVVEMTMRLPELPRSGVLLLQVAENILAAPLRAGSEFLGIPSARRSI